MKQREKEVAEILVKLPSLIWEFELPPSWGCKRKRSAIHPKRQASSPATPLSFSPSDSDENHTTLFRRNVSLKRKREHYLKIIQDLTKDNDLLVGEIKNVKCYFEKLKEQNLKLKARKQEQVQFQFPGGDVGVAATTSLSSKDVGPIGIPDLNLLPLDETIEFCEVSRARAMAAQARQNRLHIYRFKNPIGITKPRRNYYCR